MTLLRQIFFSFPGPCKSVYFFKGDCLQVLGFRNNLPHVFTGGNSCKLLTGTYKAVSQFKRRRSILILLAVFLQHTINVVMYRKEEAGDSLNNKLERQSRTEFVSNCESFISLTGEINDMSAFIPGT